jgi:signal transduction histidine kinase
MASSVQADIDAVQRIDAVPKILEVVCRSTGMGFSAVSRVTEDRWVCCAVRDEIAFGLVPGGELEIETTICHEIRQSGESVVIDHVASDETYCGHHTPAKYGFQSYISMPIMRSDGSMFGTLCAIDPNPAKLNNPQIIGMFKLFAELIAMHLDINERLDYSEANLFNERSTSELREQFIAVLGHDLRNPLASISAGADMLVRTPLNDKASRIVKLMQGSVSRMSGLIDNVLDFARGRLGGGLTIYRNVTEPLKPALDQVTDELRLSWPERPIAVDFSFAEPVNCDRVKVAQLYSNLLGNALTYGAADQPIRVRATSDSQVFELSVANSSAPIPPDVMSRLFQPFSRGAVQPHQQGLGLGLYIASEIARAHGGTLDVSSTSDETRFTFRMPLAA